MTAKKVCPKCQAELIGFQYFFDSKFHYDGVSEWLCPTDVKDDYTKSHYREGRFCGKELKDNEMEPKDCLCEFGHPREMVIEQGAEA